MAACNDKGRLEKELQALNTELESKRLEFRTLNNEEAMAREDLDRALGGVYEPEALKKQEDQIKETEASLEKAVVEQEAARKGAEDLKKRLDAYSSSLSHS